jgi:hypothetical protein
MYICLCLWFLVIAYAAYACLCSIIYLLMGHNISEGIFCQTTKYGRKGSVQFSTISGEEDLCI